MLLPKENYQIIAKSAAKWAFESDSDGNFRGGQRLRDAIEQAAYATRGDSFVELADAFCGLMKEYDFESKQDWFLHAVRAVIQTLLANPSCTYHAGDLVKIFHTINRIQRARSRAI